MTASHAEALMPKLLRLTSALLLAGPLYLGPAWADDAAPPAESSPPPVVLAPGFGLPTLSGAEPEPVTPPDPTKPNPRAVGVDRQELAAPPAESVGILDARHGGFPATLWEGSSATVVRALLPKIATAGSPTLHGLARRLLLTSAPAAKGVTEGEGPSLVELRVLRLMALGEIDGAVNLADAAPAAVRGPGLNRARIDALLLTGRVDSACAQPGAPGQDPELVKVVVICKFLAKDTLGGNLGLDLVREKKPADTAFVHAAEVLAGLPAAKSAPSLKNPTPVQLAAWGATRLPMPADAVIEAQPAELSALLKLATLPVDARLIAAERAESIGLIDTDAYRKLLSAVELAPEDLAAPLAKADSLPGPKGLALLLRAAEAAAGQPVVVPLVIKALDQAQARGAYAGAARILAPVLALIVPQASQGGFSATAARALLIGGRAEAAGAWLELARNDAETVKAAERLWPLARIFGQGDGSPTAMAAWRKATDSKKALLALSLLSGLGQGVKDSDLVPLLDVGRSLTGANPALVTLLDINARQNRLGGTLLAVLASFDDAGLDKADPALLPRIMIALRAAGLEAEAKALAAEILVAAGAV